MPGGFSRAKVVDARSSRGERRGAGRPKLAPTITQRESIVLASEILGLRELALALRQPTPTGAAAQLSRHEQLAFEGRLRWIPEPGGPLFRFSAQRRAPAWQPTHARDCLRPDREEWRNPSEWAGAMSETDSDRAVGSIWAWLMAVEGSLPYAKARIDAGRRGGKPSHVERRASFRGLLSVIARAATDQDGRPRQAPQCAAALYWLVLAPPYGFDECWWPPDIPPLEYVAPLVAARASFGALANRIRDEARQRDAPRSA